MAMRWRFDAALADERIVSFSAVGIDQTHHEVMGMRLPRGGDHGLVGRIRPAVTDVFADRAVQQGRILRDHANLPPKAVLRRRGNVLPIDQDAPALDVVKAQEQIDQRRLAGAGAPDQPNLFARRNRKGEVVAGFSGTARCRLSLTPRRRVEAAARRSSAGAQPPPPRHQGRRAAVPLQSRRGPSSRPRPRNR